MRNFIERIKSYSKRKDTADMAIRAWKSVNEEVYTNFCKRIDAVAKGGITVLMDMYQMMRDCTPPEALMMYNWLSDFAVSYLSSSFITDFLSHSLSTSLPSLVIV